MILTGPEIERLIGVTKAARAAGTLDQLSEAIDITPFDPKHVGPNSYDVHLGDTLRVYTGAHLDTRKTNPTCTFPITEKGVMLMPGTLYLGVTAERTLTTGLVPDLDGCSTIGRHGIAIHVTAGRGDDAFGEECPDGIGIAWTMEIYLVHNKPTWIYPGMRIGQLYYSTIRGDRKPYRGSYGKQQGPTAAIPH